MPEPKIVEPRHVLFCRPCGGSGEVTTNIHMLVCCHCKGRGLSIDWPRVEAEFGDLPEWQKYLRER